MTGPTGSADRRSTELTRTSVSGHLTLVSYNLWEARGQGELCPLITQNRPDVLCLQEAATQTLPETLQGMRLAVSTQGSRLGVALYVRDERFHVKAASIFRLPRSLHDRLVASADDRLVGARLRDRDTGKAIVVGSMHATPLTDPNIMRRWQVDSAHLQLHAFAPGLPMLVAGDYNYPFFTGQLHRHLRRRGFSLGRSGTSTYRKRGIMRGSSDLASSHNIDLLDVVTGPQGASAPSPHPSQREIQPLSDIGSSVDPD
jgi:exodeoxyribonuclease-3